MKRMTTDLTNVYIAKENGLRKIVISTGVDTTLAGCEDYRFDALCYGNSVLYGANTEGIYSIHVTTGVCTQISTIKDIEALVYTSTTKLAAIVKNSLLDITISTGVGTYKSQVL